MSYIVSKSLMRAHANQQ